MREWFSLVSADLAMLLLGLRRAARAIPVTPLRGVSETDLAVMRKVAGRVKAAAMWWRPGARCLPRALAVAWLLRRKGYPVSMVVAVRRFPFAAHAWVEYAGEVLTDRQGVREEFKPILRVDPIPSESRQVAGVSR